MNYVEGNGNPLPYSCLENPVDRGAWWAAIHGVAESRIWLKRLSMPACIGEGNGNPLQSSCLENPRERGVWWIAIYGISQSRTQLKWLSSSSSIWTINSCVSFLFMKKRIIPSEYLFKSMGATTTSRLWQSTTRSHDPVLPLMPWDYPCHSLLAKSTEEMVIGSSDRLCTSCCQSSLELISFPTFFSKLLLFIKFFH